MKFCKSSVSRCSRVESTWSKLSAQLAASRDAKGMPRINVATVDTTDSGWLTKCLGRSRRPPLPPLSPGGGRSGSCVSRRTRLAALGAPHAHGELPIR